MHEMAVCQAMLEQVEAIAAGRGARAVDRIILRIGPLSGVEPPLLENAFSIARAGTLAESAEMETEAVAVRLSCRICGAESEVAANRLVCGACGSLRIRLVSGDELQLARLELDIPDHHAGSAAAPAREGAHEGASDV